MTLNTFFEQFDLLADAPNGVQKLRELILQLAVQGKLVEQDPNDQPASELLKAIEAEKQRLVKEGKIRLSKPLPDIKPEEVPYDLPKGWTWVRLGYIGEFINGDRGKNYPNRNEYVHEGIPWINTGHIEPDGSLTQTEMNFITREKFNSLNSGKIEPGDLVYCLRGATFGKTAIVNPYKEGAIASSLMIIRPFAPCSNRYLYQYLISPVGRSQIFKFDNGSAQPNLSANSVRLYVYPLPPLAEQKRIVAKVDRLMDLCDRLEEQQKQRRSHCIRLGEGAVTQLLNAQTADEFDRNWKRVCDHFDLLYSAPESVQKLRQTILQLAVQGKLVPQDPGDEPGIPTLKHIEEEKEKLIEQGKLRRSKKLPPLNPETSPFRLPKGWLWIYVQDAGEVKLGRQRSPKDHFGPYMVPYLRVANVLEAQLNLSDIKEMNFSPEEQEIFRLRYGDILLNEGQSYELVGRPALYRNEIPRACFQNTLLRFRPFSKLIPEYALIVFRSYMHSGRFRQEAQQTTNIAHLSAGRLSEIEFPLPPLAEQKRIVAKVDRLMALCDRMEAQLNQVQGNSEKLMETAVRQVLAV